MNNSKKMRFRKIAFSALMVSALGSAALVANAASTSPSASTASNVKSVKPVTAPGNVTISLPDPLAVAKQYAPETASAWEKLLNEYQKVITKNTQNLLAGSAAAPTAALVPVEGNIDFSSIDLQPGKVSIVQGSKISVPSLADVTVTADTTQPADESKPVPVQSLSIAPMPVQKDGLPSDAKLELKAVPVGADSWLQGQMDLAKAVETKDAVTIKAALAKLFALYEDQIQQRQELK